MNTFPHKTTLLNLWYPFPPWVELQKFPIGTVVPLGLANISYRLWLQQLFKCFNAWNTRFNINRKIIIVFTCNLCICFILFVGVSTCSVILLLSIYRTQLFKKIIDSIHGLMLFLIRSSQLNYFFSKTFNLGLHSMTIWRIRPPKIFQVFREGDKTCSVTCLT